MFLILCSKYTINIYYTLKNHTLCYDLSKDLNLAKEFDIFSFNIISAVHVSLN